MRKAAAVELQSDTKTKITESNKLTTKNNKTKTKNSATSDKSITKPHKQSTASSSTRKTSKFMKSCSSSNSLSPSKLPPPPSPPNLLSIKSTSSKTDVLKLGNIESVIEKDDVTTIILDRNKRKSSVTSISKSRKSSLQTNKSTPDQHLSCSACSSNDINEITLKIKSCEKCNHVAIDQISYSGQTMALPNDLISILSGQNNDTATPTQSAHNASTIQQCYHHLTNITQKLKNMYRNQIHSSQSQSSSQRSSIITIPEQDTSVSFNKTTNQDKSEKNFQISFKKISPTTDQPQFRIQKLSKENDLTSKSILNSEKLIPENSSNKYSKVNGDVLVLNICDLERSSNICSNKHEQNEKTEGVRNTIQINNLKDTKNDHSMTVLSETNNQISYARKKDCKLKNLNIQLQRQSSVDATTSPTLHSPAINEEGARPNLSPNKIKTEKIPSPTQIVISPTYFAESNKKLKISLKKNELANSTDSGGPNDLGKISPSQLSFPKSVTKGGNEKRSPKYNQLQKSPSTNQYQLKQYKTKISRKTKSLQGDDIITTDRSKITISKSYRKLMVMSDYNKVGTKAKSNKNSSDFLQSNLSHRRNLLKKSRQQHAEISKSLDILLPSDILNDFSDLPESFFNLPPYNLTSKSTSNLHATVNDDDFDEEGPFERINSVELIFISDEFLNKAVKHDLQIINCETDLNEKIKSPIEIKVSKPNLSSASSSKTGSKTKLQKSSSSTESRTIKTPDSVSGGSSRKNSISPSRPDKPLITKNLSDLNIGSKKLIVISEDFKRKSLENTVIIINQNDDDKIKPPTVGQNNQLYRQESLVKIHNLPNSKDRSPGAVVTVNAIIGDSDGSSTVNSSNDCLDEMEITDKKLTNKSKTNSTTTKRKNLKDIKSWGRESSVDDVGNQMVSHAFCSAEEPDEFGLENKEIVEPAIAK